MNQIKSVWQTYTRRRLKNGRCETSNKVYPLAYGSHLRLQHRVADGDLHAEVPRLDGQEVRARIAVG